MDGHQFDTLARTLARRRSRRGLLGGLAAGLLAARNRSSTVAQGMFLGPGDACYDDAQCRGADAPLVCADNGFAYDGPLNCCTYAGSRVRLRRSVLRQRLLPWRHLRLCWPR